MFTVKCESAVVIVRFVRRPADYSAFLLSVDDCTHPDRSMAYSKSLGQRCTVGFSWTTILHCIVTAKCPEAVGSAYLCHGRRSTQNDNVGASLATGAASLLW